MPGRLDYDDVTKAVLRELERDVAKDGWDQPPRLMRVHRREFHQTKGRAHGLLLDEIEFFRVFEQMMRPPEAIAAVAHWYAEHPPDSLPDFYGVAFLFEGWSVKSGDDAAAEKLAQEWVGRLSEHPDRRESRSIYLWPVIGTPLFLNRFRDQTGPADISADTAVRGTIPKALEELTRVLAGI
jgi:hypothetical protein